jgi:ATP-binding cassette subfamily C (CFTR/MRP) protein 4
MSWLLSQMCRHNAFYYSPIIGARLRAGLVYVLFAKLSNISQFTLKISEMSKVVNMLSSDFNIIELKMPIFFASLVFPFAFVGIAIILIIRLGWPGVIGIVVPIVVFPLQTYIGKKNGQLLQKVNVHKDLRVKICT